MINKKTLQDDEIFFLISQNVQIIYKIKLI